MRASFRRKVFLAASGAGLVTALVTATLLFWSLRREMHQRIDERVLLEARLVADQLERAGGAVPAGGFEAEANRLAALVQARVTFIADDGRVVGDSWVAADRLPTVEEHGHRPEVLEARAHGVGHDRRVSATVNTEMLYTAVRVRHPARGLRAPGGACVRRAAAAACGGPAHARGRGARRGGRARLRVGPVGSAFQARRGDCAA